MTQEELNQYEDPLASLQWKDSQTVYINIFNSFSFH